MIATVASVGLFSGEGSVKVFVSAFLSRECHGHIASTERGLHGSRRSEGRMKVKR